MTWKLVFAILGILVIVTPAILSILHYLLFGKDDEE